MQIHVKQGETRVWQPSNSCDASSVLHLQYALTAFSMLQRGDVPETPPVRSAKLTSLDVSLLAKGADAFKVLATAVLVGRMGTLICHTCAELQKSS